VGTSNAFNKTRWQNHGWVEIKVGNKWYTFDTNANRFSSLRKGKWFMQKRNAMKGKVYKTQKTYNVNF
jgi:transglutaminase-like putative cysteine protease